MSTGGTDLGHQRENGGSLKAIWWDCSGKRVVHHWKNGEELTEYQWGNRVTIRGKWWDRSGKMVGDSGEIEGIGGSIAEQQWGDSGAPMGKW
jgi:hypothetical protein